jgi:hypothetical protein
MKAKKKKKNEEVQKDFQVMIVPFSGSYLTYRLPFLLVNRPFYKNNKINVLGA